MAEDAAEHYGMDANLPPIQVGQQQVSYSKKCVIMDNTVFFVFMIRELCYINPKRKPLFVCEQPPQTFIVLPAPQGVTYNVMLGLP